ncbi:Undecaprenyl phosphate-alpha-4-amino-4-deoxy-L-arabinose arabinosyl transferase [Poriferisphaera corsica]|uniref:Undecaprenyl phosphate-alpha-4-amino-4-deoxy-L-arabinose arabinosyl transferase n=1 Tax=Poriferisphaera corsica TaxID=2528020 RepID=A0A517YQB2_9BACT|nr:glycosyltransferase family 39 protein [Poriferisphaera corsica]QDU32400.1 Undecaprenyl phosphate-alpha-4-amino-4-deoxy-L-arabinose arabinosyl transferase [Poriferisphaera corsica]
MHEDQSPNTQPLPDNHLAHLQAAFPWANWKNTILLTIAIFLIRLLYLLLLSPYELAGDEAQYWDWSRHLSLSYFTKGPGVAWTIFASTKLLGSYTWTVKLPALIAFAIIMLTAARLTTLIANNDQRPGFFAAALVALCPPFFAAGQFMTIDEPFFACWIIASFFTLKAFKKQQQNQSPFLLYQLAAFIIGLGFLYKYTILLLIPGLILFALIHHKPLQTFKPKNLLPLIPATIILLITISPVFIWNAQHDWITVKHLVGHLGVEGGDRVIEQAPSFFTVQKLILNPLEMIGTQVGAFGIPLVILTFISYRLIKKQRNENPNLWLDACFLLYAALPVILFYLAVAFVKKVQPNWPVAGYLTLLPLIALPAVPQLLDYTKRLKDWKANNKPGKKPSNPWQANFHFAIGWGSVAAFIIMSAPYLSYIYPNLSGMRRVTGLKQDAAQIQKQIELTTQQTGQAPIIITDNYQKTARLAFYLPGQPTIFSAQHYYGERPTDYDRFADTNLLNPSLHNRTAILIGLTPEKWRKEFSFANIKDSAIPTSSSTYRLMIGSNFQGPTSPPKLNTFTNQQLNPQSQPIRH